MKQTLKYCFFLTLCIFLFFANSCKKKAVYYSVSDFGKIPKIDVHFHYNTTDIRYLKFADSLNFRLVSPNVDTEMPIDEQLKITTLLKNQYPEKFAFLGTFSVNNFNSTNFAKEVIARIDRCMKAGASGIKIWKNIGMVLKDTAGRYVFTDDPRFEPVFRYMETNHIPVMAHLGEPRNCWLPVNEMTLDNDRRYYKNHPQYHMYKHPEAPSYEDQINARDNLLKMYPKLRLVGAHLGSMEWSIDEVAARLDQYPNFDIDMSARIGHLQYQALGNREKVRDFMIKYQDRIMYGTDMTIHETDTNYAATTNNIQNRWFEQWLFLATDDSVLVKDIGNKKVKGLKLPQEVIDKIYYKNTTKIFRLN